MPYVLYKIDLVIDNHKNALFFRPDYDLNHSRQFRGPVHLKKNKYYGHVYEQHIRRERTQRGTARGC
jgi:hypothetical protein